MKCFLLLLLSFSLYAEDVHPKSQVPDPKELEAEAEAKAMMDAKEEQAQMQYGPNMVAVAPAANQGENAKGTYVGINVGEIASIEFTMANGTSPVFDENPNVCIERVSTQEILILDDGTEIMKYVYNVVGIKVGDFNMPCHLFKRDGTLLKEMNVEFDVLKVGGHGITGVKELGK